MLRKFRNLDKIEELEKSLSERKAELVSLNSEKRVIVEDFEKQNKKLNEIDELNQELLLREKEQNDLITKKNIEIKNLRKDIDREKRDRFVVEKGFAILEERCDRLKKENEQKTITNEWLSTQNEEWRKSFGEKIEENDKLKSENEEWKQHNKTLAKIIGELKERNKNLKRGMKK